MLKSVQYRNISKSEFYDIEFLLISLPKKKDVNMKKNTLTRAEQDIMNVLWEINHSACVWDILEHYEEPKPAYTTIATCLKVLCEKGYVDYFKNKGEGKTHKYIAKVTRAEYARQTMKDVKKNCFGGSLLSMFSYFVREENLSEDDIKEMLEMVRNQE